MTATYNSADLIQRCIDSVASQTFRGFEHILIDGASTDGTVGIIRANQDKLAYWISEPDTGVYNAWNKAVPHMRGEWVLFLGSDDKLVDRFVLEKMVPVLEDAYPEHDIVYGIVIGVKRGTEEELYVDGEPWEERKYKFNRARRELPPHPSTFQHRSLFSGENTFDETFRIAGDSDFLTRQVIRKDPLFHPLRVVFFSMGGLSGLLGKREYMMWEEELLISKRYNITVPKQILLVNLIKSVSKDLLFILFGKHLLCYIVDFYRIVTFRKPIHFKNK